MKEVIRIVWMGFILTAICFAIPAIDQAYGRVHQQWLHDGR